jgi:hypothetical protein
MMCGRRQNLRCGFFEGECNTDCQCCILLRHDEGKLRGHLGTWCAVQRQAIPRAGVSRQPVYVTGTGYKRRDQEICVGLGHPPHLRWSPESHMDRDCCATSDPHGKDQWLLWDESEAPALGPSPEGGVVQRHFRHRLYTRLGRLLFKERGGVEVAGEDRPDCTSVQRKLPTFVELCGQVLDRSVRSTRWSCWQLSLRALDDRRADGCKASGHNPEVLAIPSPNS